MEFQKTYNELLDETLYYGEHKSGLKVYVMPKKGYSKSYAIFATKYGSIDNEFVVPKTNEQIKVPDGIAHFLEHKLFEGEEGNAFDKFAKYGSSVNAFTSFNTTGYLFSCTNSFYENLDILLDFVQKPYFTKESVEKEQGIIGQEIRMYEDNPDWRVFFNFLNGLYVNHPVKKDIAGTIESISKIDKDLLYKCYETFYDPSNMILFTVGDIDCNRVGESIEKSLNRDRTINEGIKRIYSDEPENINEKEIIQNLSVSTPQFITGFKDNNVGYGGHELLKKEILTDIILEIICGYSSEFYQSLYEQGLINQTFSKDYTGEISYGFTSFGGESVTPKKVQELLIEEIANNKENGLDESKIERIKKVILSRYLRRFNNIENLANSFAFGFFKDINYLDYINVYDNITNMDVHNRFDEHFNIANMVISIVNPV